MEKMEKAPKSSKAALFLDELRSGVHARELSQKPGKRERNRVFVNAAMAAGYTELTAGRWRRDIAPVVGGELVCERAFLEGATGGNGGTAQPKAEARQVSLAEIVPEGERFDMGNPGHLARAKIASLGGTKALKYLEIRMQHKSDGEAMLAAGFTEQQARHPARLLNALNKLGGNEISQALIMNGVDSANIAEVLAQIFHTKRVVDTLVPRAGGGMEVGQTMVPDPVFVSMALTHIEKLLLLGGNRPAEDDEKSAEVDREGMKRLLEKNGLIAA